MNLELNTSYRYVITEKTAPQGYDKTLTEAIIKIYLAPNGTIKSTIERYNGMTTYIDSKKIDITSESTSVTLKISDIPKIAYMFELNKTTMNGDLIPAGDDKIGTFFNITYIEGETAEEPDIVNVDKTYNKKQQASFNTIYTIRLEEREPEEGYINIFEGKYIDIQFIATQNGISLKNNGEYNVFLRDSATGKLLTKEETYTEEYGYLYDLITLEVNNEGVTPKISVSVKNPNIKGVYNVELKKVDSETNELLDGVTFKVGNKEYKTKNGIAELPNMTITLNNFNRIDTYEIKEINVGENAYLKVNEPINLYVKKEKVGNEYRATQISFDNTTWKTEEITKEVSLINGTKVIVKAKIEDKTITVTVPNTKITGEYILKIKKVNSVRPNMLLQGVTFDIIDPDQNKSLITTDESGIAEVTGSEAKVITVPSTDTFTIKEVSTIDGYNLFKYTSIIASVETSLSEDGTKYVPVSVNLEAKSSEDSEEANKEKQMVENGMSYTINGNIVTITIPNEPNTDYSLNIVKVDEEDNTVMLDGAKFTIVGPDGNKIIENTSLENGCFTDTANDVNINKTYIYTISEDSAHAGYKNIFEKYNIKLDIVIDSNGNVDKDETRVSLQAKDLNDYNLRDWIKYRKNISVDVQANNSVQLIIENPKDTTDYELKLKKYETGSENLVYGAKFKVERSTDGINYEQISEITTPLENMLDSLTKEKVGATYYYSITETVTPNNYTSIYKNIIVKVNLELDGTVSAEITKISENADGTNSIDYNENSHSQYVSLEKDGNTVQINWSNTLTYKFKLLKKDYTGKQSVKADSMFPADSSFKIEEVTGSETKVIYEGNLENSQYLLENKEAHSNHTYHYIITETATDSRYSEMLLNEPIHVYLRTDEKGNLLSQKSETQGYYWKYDDITEYSEAEQREMYYMVDMEVENNEATIYIGNFYDNYYQVQILKVDKDNKELKDATFSIKLPDGHFVDTNLDSAVINNPITNEEGIISLGYRDLGTTGIESYIITEVIPPIGYNALTGTIELNVDLTNVTSAQDLKNENIELIYKDSDGAETTLQGLEVELNNTSGTPVITVKVPNSAEKHTFNLEKVDLNNNLISAEKVSNTKYDGSQFNVIRKLVDGDYIPDGVSREEYILKNGLLMNGTFNAETGSYSNAHYQYVLQETTSKTGYVNIFRGLDIIVDVYTDENGKLNTQNKTYKVEHRQYGADLTAEYEKYIDLNLTEDAITIKLTNPQQYRVELNKVDTNNKGMSTAVIKAYQVDETANTNIQEYTLQNQATITTDETLIPSGQQQVWRVYEESAQEPNVKVLGDNYVYVIVKNENNVITCDYELKTKDNVTIERANELYNYVNVELKENDNEPIISVTIKNPVHYNFNVTKYVQKVNDEQYTEEDRLQGAIIKIETEDTIYSNNGDSSYTIEETNINIGDEKYYKITEESTVAPHVNSLEGKYILVGIKMKDDSTLEIVENNIYTDSGGKISSANVYIETGEDLVQTVKVDIQNPMQYIFEVVKKDTTPENLGGPKDYNGAALMLEVKNAKFYNYNESGTFTPNIKLENTYAKLGETVQYKIEEQGTTSPHINILKDKYILIDVTIGENKKLVISNFGVYDETGIVDAENEIYNFISYGITEENGIEKVNVEIQNPIKYMVNVTKTKNENTALHGAKLQIESVNGVHEINAKGQVEFTEENMKIGDSVEYKIIEESTVLPYVNVFEGKYIKLIVEINEKEKLDYTYAIYDASTNEEIDKQNDIYNYVDVNKSVIKGVECVNINVKNPPKMKLQIIKTDTNNNALNGAQFKINSPVIAEQKAEHANVILKQGITSINENGEVLATTVNEGKITLEETWLNTGIYDYKVTELSTAGAQYVNILEGYEVFFRIKVEENGMLTLVDKDGLEEDIFYVQDEAGNAADKKIAELVNIQIDNTGEISVIKVYIENPVKYNILIDKDIYGYDELSLADVGIKIISPISNNHIVYTNSNGKELIEETKVEEGIYEYYFTEIETAGVEYAELLKDYYVKVNLKVNSDGTIQTLDSNLNAKDNEYELYKKYNGTLVLEDKNSTILDGCINVSITTKNDISTLNVGLKNPQIFNMQIIKEDAETQERLNNVKFNITIQDNNGQEYLLRDGNDIDKVINTTDLTTSNIDGQDGLIVVDNILFEKTGIFIMTLEETEYADGYKPIEKIKVQYEIIIENGKYKIDNVEVIEGKEYVLSANVLSETPQKIDVTVINEKIEGVMELKLNKIDVTTGNLLDGAKFSITAYKDDEIIKLKDATTGEEINLAEVTVKDGSINIKNIKLEQPGGYKLVLNEIEAPNTYLKLKSSIEIIYTVLPMGNQEELRYGITHAKIYNNLNGELVTLTYGEKIIDVTVRNEQFDLALRKFITAVDGKEISNREPVVITDGLLTGETTAIYNHSKKPVQVYANKEIIYTLRVYNEGDLDGYATTIIDHLPEGLEFVRDEFNTSRGWEIDETGRIATTKYLSHTLIKAFDVDTKTLDFADVEIKCKVKPEANMEEILTNIAEISEYNSPERENVRDCDSTELAVIPSDENLSNYKNTELENSYVSGQEDDDDFEKVEVRKYFDLSLKKWVSEAIVIENGIEKVYTGNTENDIPEPTLKVDLAKSKIDDDVVKFKYEIKVTNEGELEGYVKEIVDYVPEGLKFVQEDNENWREGEDEYKGMLTTNELAETLLKPGESAKVTVVLTWINGENNLGEKVNYAEISQDYNKYDEPDIDSTPNNFKLDEDDIDNAKVLLSVRTGGANITYIILAGICLIIVSVGVMGIKKYV